MSFLSNSSSIPFLASALLALARGEQLSEEQVTRLSELARVPSMGPLPILPASPPPKVKKIQPKTASVTEEPDILRPVDADDVVPAATANMDAFIVKVVDATKCVARKIDDENPIPGTDAAKIYPEKQCIRKRSKGELLCSVCARMEEKWRESKGKDKKWFGRIGDPVPEHLHIIGSKWFHDKYPHGIGNSAPTAPAQTLVLSVPATVLDTTAPVQEVVWKLQTIDGVPMIRHLKDRRVYRADMNKEGEDCIMWDHYQGRWNEDEGEIDYYAPEEDEE